ncbi:Unknown protein sequence [Pseudomonas syringae pv. aceris]|nr:Unknown protein sequence [Pseudomonas syringae pv. aceris]
MLVLEYVGFALLGFGRIGYGRHCWRNDKHNGGKVGMRGIQQQLCCPFRQPVALIFGEYL